MDFSWKRRRSCFKNVPQRAVGDSTCSARPSVLGARRSSGASADGGQVKFHGHRQDIETCIAGLDALVICSDHEGLPMISLEAADPGCTDGRACRRWIDRGGPGRVPGRPARGCEAIRDGILRALRADARASPRNALAIPSQRFSAERNAESMQHCTQCAQLRTRLTDRQSARTIKEKRAEC